MGNVLVVFTRVILGKEIDGIYYSDSYPDIFDG